MNLRGKSDTDTNWRMTLKLCRVTDLLQLCNFCDDITLYKIEVNKRETMHILHRAESFLKSFQSFGYSRTSQYFMEPEGSVLCSQELAIAPYPEPDESDPYHPILFLYDLF
jgi:hypothetical protein